MTLGGFKDFTAEPANSGDVDAYLMQGILVFASEAARDSELASYLEHGRHCYCTSEKSTWRYDGSAWVPIQTQWTDYTPAWTNLSVGNGVQVAKVRYIDGDLRMRGKLTWGTTTSASGIIYQTIANSETSDSAGGSGIGVYNDDSASHAYALAADIAPNDTAIGFFIAETGAVLANNAPATMTTDDIIRWDITIPVA